MSLSVIVYYLVLHRDNFRDNDSVLSLAELPMGFNQTTICQFGKLKVLTIELKLSSILYFLNLIFFRSRVWHF